MGGKASTAGGAGVGGAGLGGGPESAHATATASATRSRALSTSAGTADGEGSSAVGLLRSASQGGGGNRDRGDRGRARSLSSVPDASGTAPPLTIPALLSRAAAGGGIGGGGGSETDGSSPEEYLLDGPLSSLALGRVFTTHSLPAHLWSFNGFKCPICSKVVLPDDLECHLVICLTKPRISYNEDVLTEDKGECVICLEELCQGDTIARLPCLCIYHKSCIDEWFQVNRSCPEHPYD